MALEQTVETSENFNGNILTTYPLIKSGTMFHADELTNARRRNYCYETEHFDAKLGEEIYDTADGAIYFMDGKTPKLALTREQHHPILHHLDDTSLATARYYRPTQTEFVRAIRSSKTRIFYLTKLDLEDGGGIGEDDICSCFKISTKEYDLLSRSQRRFAERIYGQGEDFIANMNLFNKDLIGNRINTITIYVLKPEYVRKEAATGPIARMCWMYDFGADSDFMAAGFDFEGESYIRGLRKK